MNSKIQIDEFIIGRFPRFSLKALSELIDNPLTSDELLIKFSSNHIFQEALLTADPIFFNKFQMFLTGKLDGKMKKSVRTSLIRFALRSTSRPTPFGLFAGVGCGALCKQTELVLSAPEDIQKNIQFDMSILMQLTQNIENDSVFFDRIKWMPNTTLYKLADEWRYFKGDNASQKREYSLDAFFDNEIFEHIFLYAKTGRCRKELIEFLMNSDYDKLDSINFVNDLISSKIFVSELYPTLTDNFFERIKRFIERENGSVQVISSLSSTIDILNEQTQITKTDLEKIKIQLNENSMEYNLRHLYHIDYFQETVKFKVAVESVKQVIQALQRVGTINTLKLKKSPLDNFKKKFLERYGTKHVSLTEALDINNGFGALFTDKSFNADSFLDDVHFPSFQPEYVKLVWDRKAEFLNKLLQDYYKDSFNTIGIDLDIIIDSSDFEFKQLSFDSNCSVLIDLIGLAADDPIFVEHVLTSNTLALAARFGDLNDQISNHLKRIAQREISSTNKITAELVYLPENRTVNILRRPALFEYEIPYLAQSGVTNSKQILANDLYLHIQDGTLRLYSKKLEAEIRPVVSNAHNFLKHTLPVYRFLAVFGSEQNSYNFSWGALTKIYDFLPRVHYKNVIVSLARWRCYSNQLNFNSKMDSDALLQIIHDWRLKNKIPQYIQIKKGDRSLPINLKNLDCINLFLKYISDKKEFIVEEYLYKSNSLCVNQPVSHANQILVSLYNE